MSDRTEVVNVRASAYDVYCGRPSKWGNPFVIGRDGSRADVIAKYRRWIAHRPELLAALPAIDLEDAKRRPGVHRRIDVAKLPLVRG